MNPRSSYSNTKERLRFKEKQSISFWLKPVSKSRFPGRKDHLWPTLCFTCPHRRTNYTNVDNEQSSGSCSLIPVLLAFCSTMGSSQSVRYFLFKFLIWVKEAVSFVTSLKRLELLLVRKEQRGLQKKACFSNQCLDRHWNLNTTLDFRHRENGWEFWRWAFSVWEHFHDGKNQSCIFIFCCLIVLQHSGLWILLYIKSEAILTHRGKVIAHSLFSSFLTVECLSWSHLSLVCLKPVSRCDSGLF